jgi:ABC-type branched-subunit amino acid transport system ATPase component/ABC-type branched-subunit amino acid transport system permease subunit
VGERRSTGENVNAGTLVLGLINGMIIGLLAVGFVLVYKANRFLNLAQAQLGVLSAMLLAKVVNDWGWDWWPSFVACIAVGVGTGLLVERFVVSVVRRKSKSPVRLLILTIGVGEVLLALTYIPALTPTSQASFPQPFTSHVEVGGVVLTGMSVLTIIVVPIVLVLLTVLLELTSVGRQIRAAAGNPDAARLCGVSVNRVSLIVWGIAGGLSAFSAVLNGPTTASFNAQASGPYLLMLAMGAAAFGAFLSIPVAVGGGVILGLVYQVVAAQTTNAGTAELAVFATILLVILVRGGAIGRAFAVSGAAVPELRSLRVPEVLRGSRLLRSAPRWLLGASLFVALVLPRLPYFSRPGNQFLLVLVLVYAVVGVSLTILVGWAGQVSMGSFALVGIAAFQTARWAGHAGWSVLDIALVAGVVGAAVSVAIGLPALRVPGLTLAVTTLGLAVVAPDWLYLRHWVGGATPFTTPVQATTVVPRAGHISSQLDVYYLVLGVLVLVVAAAASLRRSAAGRVIIAVRDNERASAAFGITPAVVKLRVLALSGFIAATAGVFWALAWQSVSPAQFPADVSIALLALPVVGGIGSLGGTVAAAVLLYMGTFFIGPHVSGLLGSFGQNIGFLLFFAGIGVIGAMVNFPNGIAGVVRDRWQAYLNRKAARIEAKTVRQHQDRVSDDDEVELRELHKVSLSSLHFDPGAGADASVAQDTILTAHRAGGAAAPGAAPLVVGDVALRFGGIAALDGVDISVGPGEIVGLIGTNGAGKTTLMNVISGVLRADRGSVRVFGHEVAGRAPELRAHYGLARSFQDATLFAGLSVTETVQVALAHQSHSRLLPSLVPNPWARANEQNSRRRARELVDAFGLGEWADALTIELSTGMRRVCDLMAQVATQPRIMVLDEPTAGVAQREAEAFGPLVRRIRDALDCSILIVEHDMPLLMGLCDRVYAMEAGRVIAEGTAAHVRTNPAVIGSYLGTDTTAIARSGSGLLDPHHRAGVLSTQGELS